MAKKRRRKRLPTETFTAEIDSLSHDGRGVAHIDGKATFIFGGLPGEQVDFTYTGQRRSYDEGVAQAVSNPSKIRVEPRCAHFDICGGCSLQHIDAAAQVSLKQDILFSNLEKIGHVKPTEMLEPIEASKWGYRRKARLGAKFVRKKDKVLVGFRERKNAFLAELDSCVVLHESVGTKINDLRDLIAQLSIFERIPQVEVAVADNTTALIFRHLDALSDEDQTQLVNFAKKHHFSVYIQPKGVDSISPLWPENPELSYRLDEFDIDISFLPSDFTQVNSEINQKMISQAVTLLDLSDADSVLDLFCGVGNFTLPLATRCGSVVGVEGDEGLVERAKDNAAHNQLASKVTFHVANLFEPFDHQPWVGKAYNKLLLDPPRSGALEVVTNIDKLAVKRVVYVSCNPATLARDAGILVEKHGFTLEKSGVIDMFPHTTHAEAIALFVK